MLFLYLLTTMLIGFFGPFGAAKRTAVVQTTSGPVQGLILKTVNSVKYAAFTGIPFAKAPLRHLRFKPPIDPDPWTEVYNATNDAAECIQFVPDKMVIEGAEDCLKINVATRMWNLTEAPTEFKSVMVWIYGGSFVLGSSSLEKFPPDYLLEKDIVFVSLNYRGGPLGYLSLHHPNASGNAGLKDLVQGLKWVQKNIANFGGNPKNVTIIGGSAGSAAVGYLVLSDLTAGLFHGSISMSGVPLNPWAFQTPARALHQAHRLIEELGINSTDPNDILETLYDIPASDMAAATAKIARVTVNSANILESGLPIGTATDDHFVLRQNFAPFAPTIENEAVVSDPLLTECAVIKYLTGRFNQIPQIIGYEDQEMLAFVSFPDAISEIIDQCIGAAETCHMNVCESVTSAKERLHGNRSFYDDINYNELRKFINETSIRLYIAGIDQTQQFLAANNKKNPVYYYRITFYTDGPHAIAWNNSLPGAAHGDDISFIFYYARMNYSTDPMSPVRLTINRLTTLWTNFAKYGNPTPDWVDGDYPLNITWPDSGPSGITLEIGNELRIQQRFVTNDMDFVENSYWPYLSEVGACDYNSSINFTVPLKIVP